MLTLNIDINALRYSRRVCARLLVFSQQDFAIATTRSKFASLSRTGAVALAGLALSACTTVGLQVVNTPSYLSNKHSVQKDLRYGDANYQKLDLYSPDEAGKNSKTLIVFLYGGGWTSGEKGQYDFAADAFTAAGYTVAIPDYIKYPAGRFPEFVENVALAIAWLKNNIDSYAEVDDFVLMGHSAGAHIGGLLITDRHYLAAHKLQPQLFSRFVGMAGPYAFTPRKKKYQNIFNNMSNYAPMQPLHFVTGNEPTMLLLHGKDDTTVEVKNTRLFAAKVNGMGGSATAKYYEGVGHIGLLLALSRIYDFDDTVKSDILQFLQEY